MEAREGRGRGRRQLNTRKKTAENKEDSRIKGRPLKQKRKQAGEKEEPNRKRRLKKEIQET